MPRSVELGNNSYIRRAPPCVPLVDKKKMTGQALLFKSGFLTVHGPVWLYSEQLAKKPNQLVGNMLTGVQIHFVASKLQ